MANDSINPGAQPCTDGDFRGPLESQRQAQFRNAVLTVAFAAPLFWCFLRVINFYPLSVWSMFSETSPLGTSPYSYYILRGETLDKRIIDIPAISVTNALSDRNHSMVRAVEDNEAFLIDKPYPRNVQLWARAGTLPQAARMPDLLEAWGTIYNIRQPEGSRNVVRAIILDKYEWARVDYKDFQRYIKTWRVELTPQ